MRLSVACGGAVNGDLVRVVLEIRRTIPLAEWAATLSDVPGVQAVHAGRASEMFD